MHSSATPHQSIYKHNQLASRTNPNPFPPLATRANNQLAARANTQFVDSPPEHLQIRLTRRQGIYPVRRLATRTNTNPVRRLATIANTQFADSPPEYLQIQPTHRQSIYPVLRLAPKVNAVHRLATRANTIRLATKENSNPVRRISTRANTQFIYSSPEQISGSNARHRVK